MKRRIEARIAGALVVILSVLVSAPGAQTGGDALPSWNDSASKKAIIDFVGRVTRTGGSDFVLVNERIAVFDNDGPLWSERPMYFQVLFAFDRVRELAPTHAGGRSSSRSRESSRET